jgi:hypothetical protein
MEEYDYSFAPSKVRIPEMPIWCIPFGYAFFAVLSGLILPRIKARFLLQWNAGLSPRAATAYSPRLVLRGAYTATFSYALAALAWGDRQSTGNGTVSRRVDGSWLADGERQPEAIVETPGNTFPQTVCES